MSGLDGNLLSRLEQVHEDRTLAVSDASVAATGVSLDTQGPGLTDRLERVHRQRQSAQEELMLSTYQQALKSNPQQYAEAQQIARDLNIDPATVERNMDVMREQSRRRWLQSARFQAANPVLASRLQDLHFAKLAHDQVANLSLYEQIMGQMEAGHRTNERGRLGEQLRTASDPERRRQLADRIAQIDERLRYLGPQTGMMTGSARILGQLLDTGRRSLEVGTAYGLGAAGTAAVAGQLGPQAALPEEIVTVPGSFLFGLTFGALGEAASQTFKIESGNAFADMSQQGLSLDRAYLAAPAVGYVNAALEFFGASVVTAPVRKALKRKVAERMLSHQTRGSAARQFAIDWAKGVGGETLTETAQEVSNILGELAAGGDVSLDEAADRLADIAGQTLEGMILLGGIAPAAALRADVSRASRADRQQRFFEELGRAAQEGEMPGRAPDELSDFIRRAADGKGTENVYIDASELRDVLRQNEIPGDRAHEVFGDVDGVAAQGGDVVIPTGEYAAKVADTKLHEQLLPHLRVAADAASAAEAQQIQQDLEGRVAEVERALDTSEQFRQSARVVEDTIRTQLQAAYETLPTLEGRDPRAEVNPVQDARAGAKLYRDFVVTQANELGILPEEFYRRYPLQIARGEVGAAEFAQDGTSRTDTEAFRSFMEGSVVQDVVYHGTARPDRIGNRFRRKRATSGPMAFFTDSAEVASGYANTKLDTSRLNEGDPDYSSWFRVKDGRSTVNISQLWHWLSQEERARIAERATHVTQDEDTGAIIYDEGHTGGLGGYDAEYRRREARGNHLAMLVEEWLNSASLFNTEDEFLTVLKLAGLDRQVTMDSPTQQNPSVFPVYLSIRNPLDTAAIPDEVYDALENAGKRKRGKRGRGVDPWDKNYRSGPEWLEALREDRRSGRNLAWTSIPDWVTDTLKAFGYDGIKDAGGKYGGQAHAVYIPFDDAQVKSASGNRGTFDPRDPNILRSAGRDGPRGGFSPSRLAIILTERADRSTFIHEAAHYFFHVYADLAGQPDAPMRVQRDMRTLLDLYGVNGIEEWNKLNDEQQRKHHETFAYQYELYVSSGKAPTRGLAKLFAKFSGWLRRVYGSIRDELGELYRRETGQELPILTGEVREVMDRMLAAEDTVSTATSARGLVPLFQTQEESGMTDAQWEEYQERAGLSYEDAISDLSARTIRQLRWIESAKERARKDVNKQARETRERLLDDARDRLLREPIYQADRWVRRGETVDPDGNVTEEQGPHKLDAEVVRQILWLDSRPRPRRSRRGKSLATFVRDAGGISHASWTGTFPGDTGRDFRIRGVFRGKGKDTDARGSRGMDWEQMAVLAWENGYGPQDVESGSQEVRDWFVNALQDAANGEHQYRAEDHEAAGRGAEEQQAPQAEERYVSPLTRLGYGKGGLLAKEGGLHPDLVADAFGLGSGEAMVRQLLELPKFETAAQAQADDALASAYPELADPDQIEHAVEEAIHNEARARMVAAELKAASRALTPTRLMVAAAKEAARVYLARQPLKDVYMRNGEQALRSALPRYRAAESRAAKRALAAMREGNTLEVIRWKQAELMQQQLVRLAVEAQKEVEKSVASLERVFGSDEKLAKTRDLNILQAARSILSLVGIGRRPVRNPLEWFESIRESAPGTYDDLLPFVREAEMIASDAQGDYRRMTLAQFRDLVETVEALDFRSRRVRQIILNGKRVDLQATQERVIAALEDVTPEPSEVTRAAGPLRRAKNSILSWAATATRVEAWFRTLDKGTFGVMSELFRRVKDAGDQYRLRSEQALLSYEELLRNHDFGPRAKIDAGREFGYEFRDKTELLGALRHIGNLSNKRKHLLGRNWAELRDDNTMDSSKWDNWVTSLVDRGVLTKADFDLLQAIWDLNESYRKDLQDAHYANFGFRFREVEAQPFEVTFPDGQTVKYRGGYVPAKMDRGAATAVVQDIDTLAQFYDSLPMPDRGMTMQRNEQWTRPLSFDLNDGAQHLTNVLRFITMHGAVNDVNRVLADPRIETMLRRRNPAAYQRIIKPWLKRSAMQEVGIPAENEVQAVIGLMSRSANMGIMFANLGNAVQNWAGWFEATTRVSKRELLSAIGRLIWERGSLYKEVAEKSDHMATRFGRQMFELRRAVARKVAGRGVAGQTVDFLRDNTYFLQQITQNMVDATVWTAGYNDAIKAGVSEADAVAQADSHVRMTQMASDPEDISSWEYGNPIVRALFPFQSWFIRWANNNASLWQTREETGGALATYLYGTMLPLVVAQLISEVIGGRFADEDDDGWSDDVWSMWLRSHIGGVTGGAPGLGWVVGGLSRHLDDEVWNDRMPAPPFVEAASRAIAALADAAKGEDIDARDVDSLVGFFGNLTGIPVSAITRRVAYLERVRSGQFTPASDIDFARGLVTGRSGLGAR